MFHAAIVFPTLFARTTALQKYGSSVKAGEKMNTEENKRKKNTNKIEIRLWLTDVTITITTLLCVQYIYI